MAGPGDLHLYAEELLVAAATALDAVPDELGTEFLGAPERQFVSPGVPVADCCEMLTTWIAFISEGARSRRVLAANMRISTPQFHVLVLRCVPTGRVEGTRYIPPTPEELSAAAEQIHADGWAVWNYLFALINADPEALLFEQCLDLSWSPATIQSPSGGCAGWQFTITAGIDGWTPEVGT